MYMSLCEYLLIIVNSFNSIQIITSSIFNQINVTDMTSLSNGRSSNVLSTVSYSTVVHETSIME